MDRRGRGIVSLASNAVAGRAAHINWYYYGPEAERQYLVLSRVATHHPSLLRGLVRCCPPIVRMDRRDRGIVSLASNAVAGRAAYERRSGWPSRAYSPPR